MRNFLRSILAAMPLTVLLAEPTMFSPATDSLASIRAKAQMVETVAASPRTSKVLVGDPSSSLTKEKAIELAQLMASRMPGAGVVTMSKDYHGEFAPELPMNAVVVVETVKFADIRPFDVVVYKDPSGGLRFRRVLAKGSDRATIGFEMVEGSCEVAAEAILARKVALVHFRDDRPSQ